MTQWGIDSLFNPAKRHMDEEKRRLQTTREQLGDSSGGKRIDLESGKVSIRRDGDADGDDSTPASAPVVPESAAQARARARRRATKPAHEGTAHEATAHEGTAGAEPDPV